MSENWFPRGCKHYIDEAAAQLGVQDTGDSQPVGQASILPPVRRIEALIGQAHEYRHDPDVARRAIEGAEAHMACLALAFEACGSMIDEAKLEILREVHAVDESDPAHGELARLVRELGERDETIRVLSAQVVDLEAQVAAKRRPGRPKAPTPAPAPAPAPAEPEGYDGDDPEAPAPVLSPEDAAKMAEQVSRMEPIRVGPDDPNATPVVPRIAEDLKVAADAIDRAFADHKAGETQPS